MQPQDHSETIPTSPKSHVITFQAFPDPATEFHRSEHSAEGRTISLSPKFSQQQRIQHETETDDNPTLIHLPEEKKDEVDNSNIELQVANCPQDIDLREEENKVNHIFSGGRVKRNWRSVKSRVLLGMGLIHRGESLVEDKYKGIMRGTTYRFDKEGHKHSCFQAIDPNANWKKNWNFMIAVLCLIESCGAAWFLGFSQSNIIKRVGFLVAIILFDAIQLVDIILKFFTAYEQDHLLITNIRSISLRYLRKHFVIDILAILPLWILSTNFLLIKLLKIYYWATLRDAIAGSFAWIREKKVSKFRNKYTIIIISLFVCRLLDLLLCVHIVTCMMSFATKHDHISMFEIQNENWPYLQGVYFVLCTMTSVGYGELTIHLDDDKSIYISLAFLLVSIFIFAQGVSSVRMDFKAINKQQSSTKKETSLLWRWILQVEKVRGHKPLSEQLKRELQVNNLEQMMDGLIKDSTYVAQLPKYLRDQLVLRVFADFRKEFGLFFSGLKDEIKAEIFRSMEYKFFLPQTIIFWEGEEPDGLYFMRVGEILYTSKENPQLVLQYFPFLVIVGEELFENQPIKFVVRTGNNHTAGFFINKRTLLQILKKTGIRPRYVLSLIQSFRSGKKLEHQSSYLRRDTVGGKEGVGEKSTISVNSWLRNTFDLDLPEVVDQERRLSGMTLSRRGTLSRKQSHVVEGMPSPWSSQPVSINASFSNLYLGGSALNSPTDTILGKEIANHQNNLEDSSASGDRSLTHVQLHDLTRSVLDVSLDIAQSDQKSPALTRGHSFQEPPEQDEPRVVTFDFHQEETLSEEAKPDISVLELKSFEASRRPNRQRKKFERAEKIHGETDSEEEEKDVSEVVLHDISKASPVGSSMEIDLTKSEKIGPAHEDEETKSYSPVVETKPQNFIKRRERRVGNVFNYQFRRKTLFKRSKGPKKESGRTKGGSKSENFLESMNGAVGEEFQRKLSVTGHCDEEAIREEPICSLEDDIEEEEDEFLNESVDYPINKMVSNSVDLEAIDSLDGLNEAIESLELRSGLLKKRLEYVKQHINTELFQHFAKLKSLGGGSPSDKLIGSRLWFSRSTF